MDGGPLVFPTRCHGYSVLRTLRISHWKSKARGTGLRCTLMLSVREADGGREHSPTASHYICFKSSPSFPIRLCYAQISTHLSMIPCSGQCHYLMLVLCFWNCLGSGAGLSKSCHPSIHGRLSRGFSRSRSHTHPSQDANSMLLPCPSP